MHRTALALPLTLLLLAAAPAQEGGVGLTVHLLDVVHHQAVSGEVRLYRIGLPADPAQGLPAGDDIVGDFQVDADRGVRIGGLVEDAEYRILPLDAAAGTPAAIVRPRGEETEVTFRAAFPHERLLEVTVLGPGGEPITVLSVQFAGGSNYGSTARNPPWFRPRRRLPAGEVPGDSVEGVPMPVASETGVYRVAVHPGDTFTSEIRRSWWFRAPGMARVRVLAGGDVGPVLRATARTVPVADILAVVRMPDGRPVPPERATVKANAEVGWIGWVKGAWRETNDDVQVYVDVAGCEQLRFRYPVDGREPAVQTLVRSKRLR